MVSCTVQERFGNFYFMNKIKYKEKLKKRKLRDDKRKGERKYERGFWLQVLLASFGEGEWLMGIAPLALDRPSDWWSPPPKIQAPPFFCFLFASSPPRYNLARQRDFILLCKYWKCYFISPQVFFLFKEKKNSRTCLLCFCFLGILLKCYSKGNFCLLKVKEIDPNLKQIVSSFLYNTDSFLPPTPFDVFKGGDCLKGAK